MGLTICRNYLKISSVISWTTSWKVKIHKRGSWPKVPLISNYWPSNIGGKVLKFWRVSKAAFWPITITSWIYWSLFSAMTLGRLLWLWNKSLIVVIEICCWMGKRVISFTKTLLWMILGCLPYWNLKKMSCTKSSCTHQTNLWHSDSQNQLGVSAVGRRSISSTFKHKEIFAPTQTAAKTQQGDLMMFSSSLIVPKLCSSITQLP